MTPREIVAKTFAFENSGCQPYWIPIDDEVIQRVDAETGSSDWRSRLTNFVLGWHVGFGVETLPDGRARDRFGTITSSLNISHVEETPLKDASLEGYTWPDAESLEDWERIAGVFAAEKNAYRMCGMGYGLFERSWLMRGFENILVDMMESPEFVEELLDGITDVHLKVMDVIIDRVPAEAYLSGDDMCGQRGPIMGAELWRRFFKPRLARIIEHCHELGRPFVMHSCGNVLPLVEDLMEIGLDCLESLQPEAMDVFELKRRAAGKMVLIGGMGTQSTLPFASPDEVRSQTFRLALKMGQGSGYVLAPAKPVMKDVPTENVLAFVDAAIQASGCQDL